MSDPFIGEIKLFSFNFAPKGWALCNGQLLPINQNQALFSLLGTMYGGDGRVTFALPDLRSRVPLHVGSGFSQGERAGEEAHTLNMSELPAHSHLISASSNPADVSDPTGAFWSDGAKSLFAANPDTTLDPASVLTVGSSQPHGNMSPFLTLNFCIALTGIFPSQN